MGVGKSYATLHFCHHQKPRQKSSHMTNSMLYQQRNKMKILNGNKIREMKRKYFFLFVREKLQNRKIAKSQN